MALGDYSVAAALRDYIRAQALRMIELHRPAPRYGWVVSIDRAHFTATIIYEDEMHDPESTPVEVSMSGVQPDSENVRVQLSGPSNDRIISAVFGPVHVVPPS